MKNRIIFGKYIIHRFISVIGANIFAPKVLLRL